MKTKNRMRLLIFSLSLLVLATACNNSPYPGFKKMDNGVYLKYHKKGEGTQKPAVDDIVTLAMNYRTPDTVLFRSSDVPDELIFPVIEPTFEGDLYAALTLLKVGDSVSIAFPADSFFMVMAGLPELPDFIKAGTPMYFDIKLKAIQTKDEADAEHHTILEQMKEAEQEILAEYLTENKITVQPMPSGLYYIEKKQGKGPKAKPGDIMKVFVTVSLMDGRPLYSNFDAQPMDIEFGVPFDTEGLDEGLGYLSKGTRANLIVPSHLAFDSTGRNSMIPPYSTMLYDVELVDIKSKAEVEKERAEMEKKERETAQIAKDTESKNIANYLKTNNITVSPTASGLYYIETAKGSGKTPVNGKGVKVNYTLYNLKGEKLQSTLDSGQPFTFTLGQGAVIQGWDEGLLLMKEGGKGRFIIPSWLGYGDVPRSADIPAYSTLLFDIELLEVLDK